MANFVLGEIVCETWRVHNAVQYGKENSIDVLSSLQPYCSAKISNGAYEHKDVQWLAWSRSRSQSN